MKRVFLCFLLACSSNLEVVKGDSPPAPTNVTGDPLAYPRAACGAGMRAALGDTSCVPVGPTSCAEGFSPDKSGFGCAATLPADTCTGFTRPAIGQTTCVPVGDCNAAFPPAGATLVATTDSLATAIANAPAGAVLALEDGDHLISEVATPKSITIVGRCAEKAKLVPDTAGAHGMQFTGGTVTLRNLSMNGFGIAIKAALTAKVTIEDSVFDGSLYRGVTSDQGGTLTMRRSLLKNTIARKDTEGTVAVAVGKGATLTMEDSAFIDNQDAAFVTTDGLALAAKGVLTRVVVWNMKTRPDGHGGSAIRSFENTHIDIVDSVVKGAIGTAVMASARDGASSIAMKGSVISDTRVIQALDTGDGIGSAVGANNGSALVIENTTIADSKVIGLYASGDKTKASCQSCAVVRTTRSEDNIATAASCGGKGAELSLTDTVLADYGGSGATTIEEGHITMTRTLVTRAGFDVIEGQSAATGMIVAKAGTADIHDSAFVDIGEMAVLAGDTGSRVTGDGIFIGRFEAIERKYGHGFASTGNGHVEVKSSVVSNMPGVAFICDAGGGYLAASLLVGNGVGVHAQEGTTLTEVPEAPAAAGDTDLSVVTDTKFENNGARTGTGVVALPTPSF